MQLRTTGHGIGKVKFQRLRLHLTERSGAPVEVELEGGYFPVIYDPSAWQEDRATAMRLIPNLMMRYFLLSLLPGVLLAAILGKLPEDDESWLEWLAKNKLLYLAGVLPFVRDIIPTIAGKGTGQMTPGLASHRRRHRRRPPRLHRGGEDDWGNPEAWLDSVDMIGYAFRLPIDQLTTIVHKLLEAGSIGAIH